MALAKSSPLFVRKEDIVSPGKIYTRTMFVGFLKLFLFGAGCFLIAVVLIWPQLSKHRDALEEMAHGSFAVKNVNGMQMLQARFFSADRNQQPFAVLARRIEELDPDADGGEVKILLRELQADMLMSSDVWVVATADEGIYDRNRQELSLRGNVTLFSDNGYTLVTDSALIRHEKGIIRGGEPVVVKGPFGILRGEGFILRRNERTARVLKKSKLILKEKINMNAGGRP